MRKLAISILGIFLFAGTPAAQETATDVDDSYVQDILASQKDDSLDELIRNGLDVNSRDENGDTMLFFALTQSDDLAIAEKLIDAGADLNAPSTNGMTPLIVATSTATELQQQKMLIEAQNEKIALKDLEEQIQYQMKRATTMLQMLIEKGADVNQETPLGTPLMNAATNNQNSEMIDILLNAGAKINQQDSQGRTALFYAQLFGCDEIINQLIKAGADVTLRDNAGETYLEIQPSADILK